MQKNISLIQLFENQVKKTPDSAAVVYNGMTISYFELNSKANQFANFLCTKYSINQDSIFTLYLDKTDYMLIAILGILKSGAAYVPIDYNCPEDRLGYILSNINGLNLISDVNGQKKLSKYQNEKIKNLRNAAIFIDSTDFKKSINESSTDNLGRLIRSDQKAYIIYTSGTTGQPKGVMVTHENVVNFITDNNISPTFNLPIRAIFSSPYSFDVSIFDIWSNLLFGHALYILDQETLLNVKEFKNFLQINKINKLYLPAILLKLHLDTLAELKDKLLYLLTGVEPIETKLLAKMQSEQLLIINGYGPTETTVCATTYVFDPKSISKFVSIGKPIQNTSIYILDHHKNIVSAGELGELYIGGKSVSLGYYNNHDLTKEVFIENQFQTSIEKKNNKNNYLYKTGDLVKYLADGNLEYVGREDFQIKIRGYRVELKEIEAKILEYPSIENAIVLVKPNEHSDKSLIAFYVSKHILSKDDLFRFLLKNLPEYMIPTDIFPIKEIPININGKIDRDKLFVIAEKENVDNYLPPQTDLEIILCQIFASELQLKFKSVGINNNFYSLGGNSITAIKIANKILKELNIDISSNLILKYKNISNIAKELDLAKKSKITISTNKTNYGTRYPLSSAQSRLWFIEKYENGTNAYIIPYVLKIYDEVNLYTLEKSIHNVIKQHEILHTLIKTDENGNSYQEIIDIEKMPFIILKKEVFSRDERFNYIHDLANNTFKLSEEYPIRISIIHEFSEYNMIIKYLSINVHHIAFDGWSLDVLLDNIAEIYQYNKNIASGISSDELPDYTFKYSTQYKDYALWQKEFFDKTYFAKQLKFWKEKLQDFNVLNLPNDKTRPLRFDYTGKNIDFVITKKQSNKLRKIAQKLDVSLNSLFLSAYYIFLSSYSNQNDIVIGVPMSNRIFQEIENTVGFFVNSLPVRIKIDYSQTLNTYIQHVNNELIEFQAYQDVPFEKIVTEVDSLGHDTSRHPIFQVMFAIQSFGNSIKKNSNNDLIFETYADPIEYSPARFDLTTIIDDSKDEISGYFNYAISIFNQNTIENFIKTYLFILEQIANLNEKNTLAVSDIKFLTLDDYEKVILTWNKTEQKIPLDKTIHDIFEEQAQKTPDKIAVIFNDIKITYKDLNTKVNQIARYLVSAYDLSNNDLVALMLDRSENMLAVILAVLKSGAAYVPLDPDYPIDRTSYILGLSQPKVVLINQKFTDLLNQARQDDVNVESVDTEDFLNKVNKMPANNLDKRSSSFDNAYVIYTSGTTGNPKGVVIQHLGIVNRIMWMNHEYPLKENDYILQKTSYVFDVSVWELFWGIWYGATIVFAKPHEHKDVNKLGNVILDKNISIIHFVPSMLNAFITYMMEHPDITSEINKQLRYIFCSGEELKLNDAQICKKLLPNVEIHNLYGPTEASVDVLYYSCNHEKLTEVNIGKPIFNTKVYILNQYLKPVPMGGIGELYISGIGLAREYLNLPIMSIEKFRPNPFKIEDSNFYDRVYKTGDLVRFNSDCNIKYIGRNDFQVKIHGFRIELNEIESVLNTYNNIKQAIVTIKSDFTYMGEQKKILAFYVANNKLDEDDILQYLSRKLPYYMIPHGIAWIKKIPTTINGKLNIKALPEIELNDSEEYIPPTNYLEERLCKIFADILPLKNQTIGLKSDFFKLGGDSILALRLVFKINNEFQASISVHDIFLAKTIENICNIENFKNSAILEDKYKPFSMAFDDIVYDLNDVVDAYPASILQSGMILESEIHNDTYHDVFYYKVNYFFDCNKFISIWDELVNKHELLRAKFISESNGFNCLISKRINKFCSVYNFADLSEIVNLERLNNFDYNLPGLFRLIVNNCDDTFYLIFSFHHAILDGWSVASLINEFIQAYTNDLVIINNVELSYGEYIKNEILAIESSTHNNFWKQYTEKFDAVEKINWVFNSDEQNNQMSRCEINIDFVDCEQLLHFTQKHMIGVDNIFLFAYIKTLAQFLNKKNIVVGLVTNSRLEKQSGDELLGLFLNTIPLDINFSTIINNRHGVLLTFAEKVKVLKYKQFPYAKIKELANLDLLQFAFNFINFHVLNESLNQILDIGGYEKTNIPCVLNVEQNKNNFKLRLVAHEDKIDQNYLEYFTKYLLHNLRDVIWHEDENKNTLLPDDYQKIIYDWNNTEKYFPIEKTIPQLFEEQVERTPDNIAIVYESIKLTYRELNNKANILATILINKNSVNIEDLIALYLDRSEHMIISILAVLKAGAAYVPIAIDYPADRINYIINDTKTKLILTNEIYYDKLVSLKYANFSNENNDANTLYNIFIVDNISTKYNADIFASMNPIVGLKSNNLAYIIYTSGTTGTPKGVMIEHYSVVSLIFSDYISTSNKDVFAFLSAPVFDAATFEIWYPLLTGSKLLIPDNHTEIISNENSFRSFILNNNISVLWLTKTLFEILYYMDNTIFRILKYLIVGGEALNYHLIKEMLISKNKPNNLLNGYGPTESTTFACTYRINNINNMIPIGKPISNKRTYILDQSMQPLPVGVTGELYIGGVGVARGYFNNQKLTKEKFIINTFDVFNNNSAVKQILYKTGDLCRYLEDGNIEYIGRNDDQVKIRGYRIELGEIENAMCSIPEIKQSCVLVKNSDLESSNNKYLIGYYITDNKLRDNLKEEDILLKLSKILPQYMVPNYLIQMKEFPLTINGKINYKKLPDIDLNSSFEYVLPVDQIEENIATIYSEVLSIHRSKISTKDNFFKLGGNSILIIRLKNKLLEQNIIKKQDFSIAILFEYSTIKDLSQYIRENVNSVILESHINDMKILDMNNNIELDDDIAIIAMSGDFSGCNEDLSFWDIIKNGIEGIKEYSLSDCQNVGIPEHIYQSQDYVPLSGHINGIKNFDPIFWGMSFSDACAMNPTIRKMLEHSWATLEYANYIKHRKTLNIGVFMGGGNSDYYFEHVLANKDKYYIDKWSAAINNEKDALATKISYYLGLNGPAYSINTACSTGLVSIIEACKNLKLGACQLALAGGVSLLMPEQLGYIKQEGGVLSSDGHCRPFDNNATGTAIGSGVGVILLKKVRDALKDGDQIFATIKGYATNNDGDRKANYTAPSVRGQVECILNAQKMANVTSNEIGYIECHGTGTFLGDPIEVKALHDVFVYNNHDGNKCTIGSVKANIGHTDSAAGVAGVMKVCYMMQHSVIPRQINFEHCNSEIKFANEFIINKDNIPWIASKYKLAGVSSFGIGGTNAHIILSDCNNKYYSSSFVDGDPEPYILPITAKSKKSLELYKKKFTKFLNTTTSSLENIAFILQKEREVFPYRTFIVAKEKTAELYISENNIKIEQIENNRISNEIIFMFPGQGTQYENMSYDIYVNDEYFKTTVNECIKIANSHSDTDFFKILYPSIYGESGCNINNTQYAQVAIFIVSYALAKLLQSLGIYSKYCIGHSIGEYVAAVISGVFDLETAIYLVVKRGELMQKMSPGTMLSVYASNTLQLKQIIEKCQCEIAAINSTNNFVISGSNDNINILIESLKDANLEFINLNTSHAYHSRMMNTAASEFFKILQNVKINVPKHDFISNITGGFPNYSEVITAEYWSQHILKTVNFASGANAIIKKLLPNAIFIEVGPGKSLSTFMRQLKTINDSYQVLSLMKSAKEYKNHKQINEFKITLGHLWSLGGNIDFDRYHDFSQLKPLCSIPSYAFEENECWITNETNNKIIFNTPLLEEDKYFSAPIWKKIYKLSIIDNKISDTRKILLLISDSTPNEFINKFKSLSNVTIAILTNKNIYENSIEEIPIININSITHFNKFYQSTKFICFDTLIHCTTYFESNDISSLDYGLFSLFMIKQYFISQITSIKRFIVLTNNISQITGIDPINPFNGAMVGALRNIQHEEPSVKITLVDVEEYSSDSLFNSIAFLTDDDNDKFCFESSEAVYAIRHNSLWLQSYERCDIIKSERLINDNQVIIITGGLGGIGLEIAYKISCLHKNIKFILINRSHYNQDEESLKNKKIKNIIANKCNIEVKALDISDVNKVKKCIDNLYKKYSIISGIIHAAGCRPLNKNDYSLDNIKNNIKGKINGIYNILNCIDNKSSCYFVMMSSLSAILGDLNRFEYCAANSFLDYVALVPSNFKMISISWPGWIDVGMSISENVNLKLDNKLDNELNNNTLTVEEGCSLFYKLVNQTLFNHIIVSKYDLKTLRDKLFNNKEIVYNDSIHIINEDCNEIEKKIAPIFAAVLGLDEISIDDDFFSLGGNSLSAIKLVSLLKDLNINIKLDDITKNKTIRNISNSLNMNDVSFENDILILLKKGKSNKNIFFVHQVGGYVITYLELIGNISDDYNCYGLKNVSTEGNLLINTNSIEDLASVYINEIMKVQSSGEYIIVGHSMGGSIGFEISLQLMQAGKKIKNLFMIDSWAYFSSIFKKSETIKKYMQDNEHYANFFKESNITFNNNFRKSRLKMARILMKYSPKLGHVPMIIFKAKEVDYMHSLNLNDTTKATLGWDKFNTNIFDVYDIDGDHLSIIHNIGSKKIAKIIERTIL